MTLSPASADQVTVQYATAAGTATQGEDFTETVGTLTFSAGDTEKTVTVTTAQDQLDEGSETFPLTLSVPMNAVLANGRARLAASGTILDDDGPIAEAVSPAWGLVPSGLAAGDSFRLLFVSSTTGSATSAAIGVYDTRVRTAAASGHTDIQAHSTHFRALVSVEAVDARDHTGTTHTTSDPGVPVYWLDGDKVADDYSDFYDGDWGSNTPEDESGTAIAAGAAVFTGTSGSGTKVASLYLGTAGNEVRVGKPGTLGEELDSDTNHNKDQEVPYYALSGIFTIVAGAPVLSTVAVDGDELTLTYGVDLDSNSVPEPGDFGVTVAGAARTVASVAVSGRAVVLTLSSAAVPGDTVTLTYTPGTNPIKDVAGTEAVSLTDQSVTNNTLPVLSVEDAAASEGDAVEFTVTMSHASAQQVGLDYATSSVTATQGTDFTETTGTLTLAAGATEGTVTVPTIEDLVIEGDETFTLTLSEVTNATLSGGGPELEATGTIEDDDEAPEVEVPTSWGLIPSGLTIGDSFRLLFISSTGRDAADAEIATYDTHVRSAAYSGHADIRAYSSAFAALGSTSVVDARDNTFTTYTSSDPGVPIYWLDGEKVADDYSDFYDGDWDSNAPKTESGTTAGSEIEVFTGSNADGTGKERQHLGRVDGDRVTVGQPGIAGVELDIGEGRNKSQELAFFGLSTVLTVADIEVTPVLSIVEASALEGESIEFTVALSPASTETVMVEYEMTGGTATPGTDFVGTTGTLTFLAGDTEEKITVATVEDQLVETNETFFLTLSEATNATLLGGGSTLAVNGTILNDDRLEVQPLWGLVPSGLTIGDSFRLLFVSSTVRDGTAQPIIAYDSHVRMAAASGHADIRVFSTEFNALGSTSATDARDNTATTPTTSDPGVPIYWLGGDKVADDYSDFYEGGWNSDAPTDESGGTVQSSAEVFTGSNDDGTKAVRQHLGRVTGNLVVIGKPGTVGGELDSGENRQKSEDLAFYGLSNVFSVSATAPPRLVAATVTGPLLTLTYNEPLDSTSKPAPGDFSVTVGVTSVSVTEVSVSGSDVVLTLTTAVRPREGVSVSYTPRTNPIQNAVGIGAAPLDHFLVKNDTLPILLVSDVVATEGDPLQFSVTLSPPSFSDTVTVQYSTEDGTAREGLDFERASGLLTFAPFDTHKTITLTTIEDQIDEGSETFALTLSEPMHATLSGLLPSVSYSGTILDDDEPQAATVPVDWGLVPSGLAAGDSFRLLFVSSTARHGGSVAIGTYDMLVRTAAANGHADIQRYNSHFRAVGSTAAVDARSHTATTHTSNEAGVPIYWLGGDKVADDYSDFYDGDWDSNTPKQESGTAVSTVAEVFTGSNNDGTRAANQYFGAQ